MSRPQESIRNFDSAIDRRLYSIGPQMISATNALKHAGSGRRRQHLPTIVFPRHYSVFNSSRDADVAVSQFHTPPPPPMTPTPRIIPPPLPVPLTAATATPFISPPTSPLRRRTLAPLPPAGIPSMMTPSFASASHLHPSSGGLCGSPPPVASTSTSRRRPSLTAPPPNLLDHIIPSYGGLVPKFEHSSLTAAICPPAAFPKRSSLNRDVATQVDIVPTSLTKKNDAGVQAVPSSSDVSTE